MGPLGSRPVPITPDAAPDPAATLVRSMRRIAQAVDIRSREVARLTGLTIPQLFVLQAIRSLGEVTTQAISRDAAMSPATVVAVLDKLCAKGLVSRYRSAVDRRVVHARLTPEGEAALSDAPGLLGQGFLSRFSALPPADQARLADGLAALAELMTEPRAAERDREPG